MHRSPAACRFARRAALTALALFPLVLRASPTAAVGWCDFALQLLAPYNSAPAPYYARLTWTPPGGRATALPAC